MESKVISQIAEKLFYKSSKIPEPLQRKGDSPAPLKAVDSFQPSADLTAVKNHASGQGVDENRAYEVERAKQLVQENRYSLDEKVIDQIAEKIVAILM